MERQTTVETHQVEERLSTYYVVPGHYTQDFENKRDHSFEDALARAVTRAKPLGRGLEGNARAFVDERGIFEVEHGQSDRVVRRWEVFSDGSYTEMWTQA